MKNLINYLAENPRKARKIRHNNTKISSPK